MYVLKRNNHNSTRRKERRHHIYITWFKLKSNRKEEEGKDNDD